MVYMYSYILNHTKSPTEIIRFVVHLQNIAVNILYKSRLKKNIIRCTLIYVFKTITLLF